MKIENILNRLLAVNQKMADLKKESDDLKRMADKQIGPENRLDIGGYAFLRETKFKKRYSIAKLRELLPDQDALNSCLVPDNKLVKKTLKRLDASPEIIQTLDDSMEILSESTSILLRKINTKA